MGLEKQSQQAADKKREAAEALTFSERRTLNALERPLRNILGNIAPEIEQGAYAAIIGDDSSGRIPALMVWHAAKAMDRGEGISAPLCRFVAGVKGISLEAEEARREMLKEHFLHIKEEAEKAGYQNPKKVLVVTEAIASGSTVDLMVEALHEAGMEADIAAFSSLMSPWAKSAFEEKWDGTVIRGKWGDVSLHRKGKHLSGVHKENKVDLFAHVTDKDIVGQQKVNAARAYTQEIAERVAQAYRLKQAA